MASSVSGEPEGSGWVLVDQPDPDEDWVDLGTLPVHHFLAVDRQRIDAAVLDMGRSDIEVIAGGRAKKVGVLQSFPGQVVVLAQSRFKSGEMKGDFKTATAIRQRADQIGLPYSCLSVEGPSCEAKGMFVVGRASGDLLTSLDKQDPLETRVQQGLHVLSGVTQLHRLGFVHGDLKPDNFLYMKKGIEKWSS